MKIEAFSHLALISCDLFVHEDMNAEQEAKFRAAFYHLCQDMRFADKVAQYLYSNNQLNMNQRDEIRSLPNNATKNKCLLQYISHRDAEAYEMLYEMLVQTDQVLLAQKLWMPNLGSFPEPRSSNPPAPVGEVNRQLHEEGYPRTFLYRHGEDPDPSGDVADLIIS